MQTRTNFICMWPSCITSNKLISRKVPRLVRWCWTLRLLELGERLIVLTLSKSIWKDSGFSLNWLFSTWVAVEWVKWISCSSVREVFVDSVEVWMWLNECSVALLRSLFTIFGRWDKWMACWFLKRISTISSSMNIK